MICWKRFEASDMNTAQTKRNLKRREKTLTPSIGSVCRIARSTATMTSIPVFPYQLFFLYIEPISALAGAYYAALKPEDYIRDLSMKSSAAKAVPFLTVPMGMTLAQLANLYLLFALNEHLVLSSTSSLRTWRRLLLCLLIADFGHLATMVPLGTGVFWKVWEWNAMVWGSVGFVYLGASLRISFLLGLGLVGSGQKHDVKKSL